MAKHVITEAYTFVPATRTITLIGRFLRREQLVLITNVTTNTVIYNFSDSALGASAYTTSTTDNTESTSIVLTYNTTSMSSTDKLSILVEETYEEFFPAETLMDPVTKMRVSTPQSLIDTDFEYGTQPTKWETIALLNNRPSAFLDNSGLAATVTNITGAGTRLVTVALTATTINGVAISTSTPIFIQDSTNLDANGWVLPVSVSANVNFTYNANAVIPAGSIFDASKTLVYLGTFFTGSNIPVATAAGAAFTFSGTTITCTTTNNHGLSIGDGIFVLGTTATTNPPNGTWFVRTTPTSNTFTFDALLAPTGTITAVATSLQVRTFGSSIHRPFDGGVNFTAGVPYNGNQLIRQTRRYFRYQSGKGMQFSTGSNFCPAVNLDSLTASGTTVTATFKTAHSLGAGAVIQVTGAEQAAYNGTFTVVSTPTLNTLTYTTGSPPSASPATGFPINIQPKNWYGAAVRVGMFDTQNGFFFEYDGQTLYVCQRRSTDQLSGYISVLTIGTTAATGVGTRWSSQLNPGDYVVIRGMSYLVQSIISDTSMVIYPEYRGITIGGSSQVIISKTITTRIPQSQWNCDRMDGTGHSGFNIDITKMQMWYIDYSWYGAGAIRFGFKDQRGEVVYCHRIANANKQTEAYMRSGNLPARYEVNTLWPYTKITSSVANVENSVINVANTDGFPPSGTLVLTASGNTGAAIECVNYTSKTSTTFNGLTRAVTNLTGPGGFTGMGGNSVAQTFTFSATAPVQVALYAPQAGVTIGHWGSSVLMDGRYDDDKSFLFNYGDTAQRTYATSGTRFAVFSIRLAPSVDNGIVGLLGARELINRMQLVLVSCGVFTTTAAVRVELILNARLSAGTVGTWTNLGGSSLVQFAVHSNNTTLVGGESIFTFFAPAGGVSSQSLAQIRDLGNSILGGGNNATPVLNSSANFYPDGPDVLTLTVTPLAANAAVATRLVWSEAQA